MPLSRSSAALGAGLVLSLGAATPAAIAVAPEPAVPTVRAAASPPVAPPSTGAQRARIASVDNRFDLDSPVRTALARAIDPEATACGPTEFDAYVAEVVGGLSLDELLFLVFSGALEFATYDALVYGTEADPRYDLTRDRQQLERTFRDAQRFWDVDTSDVQLVAMDGSVLRDRSRLTRLLTEVYRFGAAEAAAYADTVVTTITAIPELRDGDNPIFTLNAFAFSAEGHTDPLISSIPDKIVVGDGIVDAVETLGSGDVGPEAVLAHEFAHHVQFEAGLLTSSLTGPEATRRSELMADAMGTYQLTHKRGLALNARRVLDAEWTFFRIGDCQFDNPGHHGTPYQRLRASTWGASLARSHRPQSRVLPSRTVARRFDAALPSIVAPDAG